MGCVLFIGDDFHEVDDSRIEKLSDTELVEGLQGAIIGLDAIEERMVMTGLLNHGVTKNEADDSLREKIQCGMKKVAEELERRVGSEKVKLIIEKTNELLYD